MFLGERVDEFATRVADAHRMRDECEAALLFRFYVRSMPTSDVRALNELQVQQPLTRAQSARLRSADAGALIEEVRLEYAHAMNGLLLRDGLRRLPLRDKVRADLLLPPPPPPPPELGVVLIEENDFVGATLLLPRHVEPRDGAGGAGSPWRSTSACSSGGSRSSTSRSRARSASRTSSNPGAAPQD